ncbi:ceramide kinase-like [Homarus americanus]|uniref:ceramide kinase-like n=1 Tax=Homarus americanus TaxID=6706 RepID=UPI001C462322|nr:ceramide kinase-like [Homarus americanus]
MVVSTANMHLQGSFYILKKRCKVTLTHDGISWVPEGNPECYRQVRPAEILGCWLCPKASLSCCHYAHPITPTPGHASPLAVARCKHSLGKGMDSGLTLEYCDRGRGLKWKSRTVVLVHAAGDVVVTWHHAIWSLIQGLTLRPRKVLVVINPVGGKRQAHQIYKQKVAPLFSRAALHTTVVQTEYRGHGRQLVEDGVGMEEMDGVVAVGGDGLVNELVMGLLMSAARKAGIDPHDPDIILPTTHLRLGIIPGGSTDAMCHGTHGTSDVTTAALHIIMGDSRCVDVAAIHRNNHLQSVATTMVSYGYFGDLLKTSEQWRKLGPSRYLVSGVLQFLKNRSYEGQLRVLTPANPLAQPYDINICSHQCSVCDKAAMSLPTPGDWLQFTGRWSVVTSALVSCACRLSPCGISPSAHLGDGCTDLILVSGGSRCRILSYLFRTAYMGNAVSLNHVNLHRVQEVHFTPKLTGPKSSWNCDGEQLLEPALRLKVHCQRLRLFCRGVEIGTEDFSKTAPNSKSASL